MGLADDVDLPISWINEAHPGRVWVTALGHYEAVLDRADVQQHILEGLRWTAGYDIAGCTDSLAPNYDPEATLDDGTCEPAYISGSNSPGYQISINRIGKRIHVSIIYPGVSRITISDVKGNVVTAFHALGGGESISPKLQPGVYFIRTYPATTSESVLLF
jgi:hypothetical protein